MNFIDLILFGLFTFIIYCDLSVFKKQNQELFSKIARLPIWVFVFLGSTFVALFFYPHARQNVLVLLCMMAFLIYIVKRINFRKTMKHTYSSSGEIDRSLFLASDAFGVLYLWILGMLSIALSLKAVWYFYPQLESKLGELVIISAFSSILFIVLIYKTVKKYPDIDFLKILGLRKNNLPAMQLFVIPALIGLGLAALTSYFIMSRAYQPLTPLGETIEQTASSTVFFSFLLVAVLLAPFFEEAIFRGYFFYVLEKIKGRIFAIIAIGSMFGLLHFDQYWGDWLAIAVVTLLGFILTLLRALKGTSIPSITLHYAYNASMTIIPIIVLVLSNPLFFEYQMNYKKLNSQEKETLLRKSIMQYPEHGPSYNDLAWLFAQEERDLTEALMMADKALSFDEKEYAYLDTKSEVLYKMGRAKEAIIIAEELFEKYPHDDYIKSQLEKFRISVTQELLELDIQGISE